MRAATLALGLLACTEFTAPADGDAGGGASDAGATADGGGAPTDRASCKELRAAGVATSGIYTLRPPDASTTLEVYCDMTTEGGGWTLVGRSAAAASARFGWKVTTGDVRSQSAAYSLDATRLAPFTEILFGARGDAMQWSAPVYARALPAKFLTTYGTTLAPAAGSRGISGCTTQPGTDEPYMLSRAGKAGNDEHFVFTDSDATPTFGLWPDGWSTNGSGAGTCQYDGKLTDKQGMLFVR